MALRPLRGCLLAAALAVCGLTACKTSKTAELDKRCEQLAKTCGDKDKHADKILDECKEAAKKQADKGCTAKATAVYDCYEKEVCGGDEKVWALEDLRVLADRHKKCVAERAASAECTDK